MQQEACWNCFISFVANRYDTNADTEGLCRPEPRDLLPWIIYSTGTYRMTCHLVYIGHAAWGNVSFHREWSSWIKRTLTHNMDEFLHRDQKAGSTQVECSWRSASCQGDFNTRVMRHWNDIYYLFDMLTRGILYIQNILVRQLMIILW